jgi:hypothetical protein
MKGIRRCTSLAGVAASVLLAAATARAEIYLDVEADPMPLIEITVVVPAGFESTRAEEAGAATLMGDILDAGTKSLARPAFSIASPLSARATDLGLNLYW